jgi:hypothetical protein
LRGQEFVAPTTDLVFIPTTPGKSVACQCGPTLLRKTQTTYTMGVATTEEARKITAMIVEEYMVEVTAE